MHEQPDVVAIDCSIADMQSVDVLRRIKAELQRTLVIGILCKKEASGCVQLLKQCAIDYIVKYETMQDRLSTSLLHLQEIISLKHELSRLKEGAVPADANGNGLSQLFNREIS